MSSISSDDEVLTVMRHMSRCYHACKVGEILARWYSTGKGLAPLKWRHIDACCGSAGKSTEQTSPFWKKSEKKRDFWRTSNDGNCSFLGTRRERTTCARQSFMAGSVARNDEVVQEGDGQTTAETGWDHQSQNAQEWHRNENSELWRTMVSLSQVIDLQQWRWSSPVQSRYSITALEQGGGQVGSRMGLPLPAITPQESSLSPPPPRKFVFFLSGNNYSGKFRRTF